MTKQLINTSSPVLSCVHTLQMNITIPYRFESSQSLTWPNHVLTAQDVRICYHFQNIRRLKKDRYSHPRDGILYTDTGKQQTIPPHSISHHLLPYCYYDAFISFVLSSCFDIVLL